MPESYSLPGKEQQSSNLPLIVVDKRLKWSSFNSMTESLNIIDESHLPDN